jgi:enterochelin esterase-like enzyme
VQTANPHVTPYIYLTAGEKEALLEPIRRFAEQLHEKGFAYEFHTSSGGHNWNEWDAQLPDCFTKLLETVPTDAN